jgi:hypothetical protein
MKQDRFLLAILAGIGILVIAALALFFVRRGAQAYLPDDSPRTAVHNYLLALENQDFERAYAYLVEAENKPTFDVFQRTFLERRADPGSASVLIGESKPSGDGLLLDLVIVHAGSGPFEDTYREPASALLKQDSAGSWKIVSLPYPFWYWDWYATPVKTP